MTKNETRMMKVYTGRVWFTLAMFSIFLGDTPCSYGAFHFMQIEQIIGGVNGDITAQAIQLRMKSSGQNVVSNAAVRAVDATGSNQVLLEDMTTDVSNSQSGRRILLATPNFANYTSIPLVADFVMDPIPASYLAAGQVRFMDNGSTIYWSVSWGGSSFTGSTTGSTTNDIDGIFGPPVNMALPSTSLQALQFTGTATAPSTNNLAQYALTAGAATFINNAGTSFTLVAPPDPTGDFDEDGDVDGRDFLKWQRGESPDPLSADDLAIWQEQYGTTPPLSATTAVPEPGLGAAILGSFASLRFVRRRRAAGR
jgi:hypothetical protein